MPRHDLSDFSTVVRSSTAVLDPYEYENDTHADGAVSVCEPWCEIHASSHVPGGFACEVFSAEVWGGAE